MNCEIFCSSSVKNAIGNLIGIALNLWIARENIVILTILILPTQEHGNLSICLHHLWFLTSVSYNFLCTVFCLLAAAAAAKLLQSCLTLCDPIDGSPPGSPIPGILQARTLEWVAISFSNAWKWKVKVKLLSRVRPSATPWTAAYQAPPSMGFSRQEYWSGVPLPSPFFLLRYVYS